MKPIQIADDIIPLAQFKTRASQIFRELHRGQRPVVITQNGKPAGVLVTPEEYDRIQEHQRFLAAVQEGFEDIDAGRWVADEDLEAELAVELGWE